jgi:plasmid stability protein
MAKMIQIRDVPDALHRTLKARAALEGKSLSAFLLEIVRDTAERPPLEDLRRRLAALESIDPGESSVEALRAARGG